MGCATMVCAHTFPGRRVSYNMQAPHTHARTLLLRMHILHVYAMYALHFSGSKMGLAA